MASLGDLVVNLTANSGQFTRKMQQARGVVSDFALSATAAAVTAAGIGLVKLAADAETLQTQFRTLLGSTSEAARLMEDINTFAAETPFQKLELADATRKLLAFNVSQDEALPLLRNIGDISALTGNRIGDLAEIYGKARVQGRLFAEDINQLTGRGIPIIQELANQFGVAESEVRKLVETGQVTSDNITRAFRDMTGEGGKFQNGMKDLSRTTAGQFSTLKDGLTAIGTTMGQILLPTANSLIRFVSELVNRFAAWGRGIVVVGGALLAAVTAMRAITFATQAYAKAVAVTNALQGPKGLAQLAAGLAAAAAAAFALDRAFKPVNEELAANVQNAAAATEELNKLQQAMAAPMPDAAVGGNDAIKAADSFRDRIRQLRDEVLQLRGVMTDSGIEIMRALEEGMDPRRVEVLAAALNMRDSLQQQKEMMQRQAELRQRMIDTGKAQADSIRAAIETPEQAIDRKLMEATRLFEQGFLSAKDLLAFDKKLNEAPQKQQSERFAGVMEKGSSDALRAILFAGRNNPDLIESKKQTVELKKISQQTKEWLARQEARNAKLELKRQEKV